MRQCFQLIYYSALLQRLQWSAVCHLSWSSPQRSIEDMATRKISVSGVESKVMPTIPVAENIRNDAAITRRCSALLRNFEVVFFKFLGSQKRKSCSMKSGFVGGQACGYQLSPVIRSWNHRRLETGSAAMEVTVGIYRPKVFELTSCWEFLDIPY
jgi:hypothetical protein